MTSIAPTTVNLNTVDFVRIKKTAPKLFVLDTNVILHDSQCIQRFDEHDVVIPITVLEELDQFKRGKEDINQQARAFLRSLDALTGSLVSATGTPRGEGMGNIRVLLSGPLQQALRDAFLQDSPDHRILNVAFKLKNSEPNRRVVLVTKDTNLRMKAKTLGLLAEDYTSGRVESIEKLYTGKRLMENISGDAIDAFYQGNGEVPIDRLPLNTEPTSNENFIFRNGSKSVLATYQRQKSSMTRVERMTAYGITARNAEQSFALRALMQDDIRLITIAGRAGTGKTLLALASALECRARYRQIMLSRPVVPLSNRDLGYLPGDISAKLDPYMQPLYDNLSVIRHQFSDSEGAAQRIADMLESEKLVISPLAYIRGRSLQRMFMIVDEAQNLTPHEIKTIITRAGEGTKIVFTGDIHQIDQPYLDALSNGMSYLINRMQNNDLYAHITLEKGERSDLADLASNLL